MNIYLKIFNHPLLTLIHPTSQLHKHKLQQINLLKNLQPPLKPDLKPVYNLIQYGRKPNNLQIYPISGHYERQLNADING
ncbi:MAG TPA: hypothetical protein EYQ50_04630 [Verrucomicrobiales bacterium]|nr:hypothetical protein [Verrucomicrobiales bacterium]